MFAAPGRTGTPRLESALTPLGFGAAEFVASRHTGEVLTKEHSIANRY